MFVDGLEISDDQCTYTYTRKGKEGCSLVDISAVSENDSIIDITFGVFLIFAGSKFIRLSFSVIIFFITFAAVFFIM